MDLDSIAFAAGHGNKVLDENGKPKRTEDNSKFLYIDKTEEELIASVDSIMIGILVKGGFTHYIGYIKGSKTTVSRKLINPEYKENRSKESPKWLLVS